MIKYCLDKWNKNKDRLEEALRQGTKWGSCYYKNLVIAITRYILNDGTLYEDWDTNNITEIDNGDYQGTLLYLIPRDCYQPAEYEYLITYAGYGSCSGCDALMAIQSENYDEKLTERQVKDMMRLCKDIVANIKKPYNTGWRFSEEFLEVEYKDEYTERTE